MGVIQRQGIRNTFITYTGIVLGFVSLIFIQPNFLTKEELGLTRILFSFSGLVATFMPLGIQSITIKYFPLFRNIDKRHNGYFGFMLLFPLAGFILVSLLFFVFKDWIMLRYVSHAKLFADYFNYVFPLTLILGLIIALSSYCNALFKTSVPAFVNEVLVRLLSIALFTIYFVKWITLDQFVFLFVSIYGLQLLVLVIYIIRIDKPGVKIDMSFLRTQNPGSMISFGLFVSLAALSGLGLKYIDTIMLGIYKPVIPGFNALDVIGIYTIAAFAPTVIEAPFNALDKITSGKLGQAWAFKNMEEVKEIYYKSTKYLMLIGGLLLLGVNINIEAIMKLLPKDYSLGIPVVHIISAGTFINMATGVNDSVLFNSPKYVYGSFMLMGLFVLAVICNMIFIPIYGIVGAAMATALAAVVYNLFKFIFIKVNFGLQPFSIKTLLILFVIAMCFGINFILPVMANPVLDMIVRSFVITIVYALAVYFFKIVPEFHRYIPFLKKKN